MTSTWQKLRLDPVARERMHQRDLLVRAIRQYFWSEDFLEVETPQLVPLPSMEPNLEVFETTLRNDQEQTARAFLTSSPEFAIKKILAAGYPRVFEVCKSYRNKEGLSTRHNPEFTILEWYRTSADYTAIMADCEHLLRAMARATNKDTLAYQGKEYDIFAPWERLTVAEAFARYSQIDTETLLSDTGLRSAARAKGYAIEKHTTWEELFHQIMLNEIEPHLGASRPTILMDYPASLASLSRKKPADPRFAERFEFYIAGLELGNAFSELVDADEQLARLQADRQEKEQLGRTLYDIDTELIAALRAGIPPTGGIAVGVDRLCMLFLDVPHIADTLFFPAIELWPML